MISFLKRETNKKEDKIKMTKFRWVLWGALFSLILFLAIYFLVYVKVTSVDAPDILKLGNMDVTNVGVFFSSIKNVILISMIIGFLLGFLTSIGSKETNVN
jgi:hypothetical protein